MLDFGNNPAQPESLPPHQVDPRRRRARRTGRRFKKVFPHSKVPDFSAIGIVGGSVGASARPAASTEQRWRSEEGTMNFYAANRCHAGRARRAPHVQRSLATPGGVDRRRAGGHVRVRHPPYAQRTCCSASGGCTCSCSCSSRASRARRTCSSSRSRSRTSCRARTPRFSSSACTAWCTRTRSACTRCCTRCSAHRAGTPASPALPCPLTCDPPRAT